MNKFKKAPLLIAALFLVLSSCVNHPRASSSIINGGSDSTVINNSSNNPASSSGGGASSTTSYSVPPVDYDSKWNIDLSLRGAKFRNALQELMDVKQTNTTSYNNCLSLGAKAAAYPTASSSTFVPFYHDATCLSITTLLLPLLLVNVIENILGQILEEVGQLVLALIRLSLDQH